MDLSHGDPSLVATILLLSTTDKKVMWFDLDLSSMPYQILKSPPTKRRESG